jgi:hypothetical protein
MTRDQAKAICRHLRIAQQSLYASAPATAAINNRISNVEKNMDPDSAAYLGDSGAVVEKLKQIGAELENMKAVRPGTARDSEKMPNRKPAAFLPGVVDALEQIGKAVALLQPHVPSNVGNVSR